MTPAARASGPWAALGNGLVLLLLVALAVALSRWQPGTWWRAPPPPTRWAWAALGLAAYAAFAGWTLWRTRRAPLPQADTIDAQTLLLAHASQTGFALQLAERSAQALRSAGLDVHVQPLSVVDAASLGRYRRALFVVSTTGEGDPPDPALRFVREVMGTQVPVPHLAYAVLALGDASYAQYCGFGRQLDQWLRAQGATPLFDRVEVDNADDGALRHWQHHLARLSGSEEPADWLAPRYGAWTLSARTHLNPGSLGGAVHHVALRAEGPCPDWQAGDLVELGPEHPAAEVQAWLGAHGLDGAQPVHVDGLTVPLARALARRQLPAQPPTRVHQALVEALPLLPHREYSIASLPADGEVHLLVRRMLRPDGRPGLASGWLCESAPLGATIALRLRANPNFHAPAPDVPLILIGNGTGMAGLFALLKARIAAGARRNWLLFGERSAACDLHCGQTLRAWQADGWIERLDLAFSRDHDAPHHYVQDALAASAETLQAWLDAGACVMVCGSLKGMAPAIDACLERLIGADGRQALIEQGRYRRDVY